jgi:hypothetical protein
MLYSVKFKKKLNGEVAVRSTEYYDVENMEEVLKNINVRYGDKCYDIMIEKVEGSNSKASNNGVESNQGALFADGHEA